MDPKKIGYTKPDFALHRELERKLVRIATRGVTQLFNAVAERQKFLESKVEQMANKSIKERKRIIEDLKKYEFGKQQNGDDTKGSAAKRIKLQPMQGLAKKPKKEPSELSDNFDVSGISSGPEDTDIEIKEEFDGD